jgi:hypothetical protein
VIFPCLSSAILSFILWRFFPLLFPPSTQIYGRVVWDGAKSGMRL